MLDVQKATTEELQQILLEDAENPVPVWDAAFLYEVMAELAKRNQESSLNRKTSQQAWQEFLLHYAPAEFFDLPSSTDNVPFRSPLSHEQQDAQIEELTIGKFANCK